MRTRTPLILLGAVLLASVAACGRTAPPTAAPGHAAAGAVRVEVAQSSLGPILTDQNGRTLYAFTNDKGGTSTCTAQCIATWPALTSQRPVTPGPGTDRALLSRTGTAQATYGS